MSASSWNTCEGRNRGIENEGHQNHMCAAPRTYFLWTQQRAQVANDQRSSPVKELGIFAEQLQKTLTTTSVTMCVSVADPVLVVILPDHQPTVQPILARVLVRIVGELGKHFHG